MLCVVGSSLKLVKFEPTTLNMSRQGGVKRAQHAGPNNVAIWCVEMVRSFGLGLRLY